MQTRELAALKNALAMSKTSTSNPIEVNGRMIRETRDASGKVIRTEDVGSAKADFAPLRLEKDGKPILVNYGEPIPEGATYPVNVNKDLTPKQEESINANVAKLTSWIDPEDPSTFTGTNSGYIDYLNRYDPNFNWSVSEPVPGTGILGKFGFGGESAKLIKTPKTGGVSTNTSSQTETIRVTSPDGKTGTIPASQLDDAIKAGYKRIQ